MEIPENSNSIENEIIRVKKKRKKNFTNLFLLLVLAFIFFYAGAVWEKRQIVSVGSGDQSENSFLKSFANPKDLFVNTDANKPDKVDFDIFWEVWKNVDNKFVDQEKLDPEERVYGAIRGMVGALGDPYSTFMDPQEAEDFNEDMEGSFEGIGAELGMRDDILTVIAPIEGMPAEKAGLRAGDKIFKINGELTSDITIDEAVKKIRGPKGTQVTLTIVRNGDSKTQDIAITRDTIEIKSVVYEKKNDSIGYIRINKFSEDTDKEFNREITKLIADGSRGMVLDLRNNPGGYLEVSVDIASKFIPKNEVVVWEQDKNGNRRASYTRGGDNLSDLPVVVLINEGSASASEILAGALRDNKGSKLVGKKSFGKGSVQQLQEMKDGSSLKVTVAKWLTPSGQSIHEVGLSPDIEVEYTEDDFNNDRDPQLDRALEEVKSQISQ